MTQREIQENLIRTVRDMLLTSCEKMGAQSIEHCWTRHDGTEVKLILAIHPAGEKEEKPEDKLYTYARAAVQKFGMNKQVDMAIEEMSELTKALLKYRRASDCATTVKSGDNIREEMEDVRIMLAQLDCIYGHSPQWAEKKLAHLKELVKGEEGDGDPSAFTRWRRASCPNRYENRRFGRRHPCPRGLGGRVGVPLLGQSLLLRGQFYP